MGCLGLRVEHPNEISGAIRQALAAERPTVVEVAAALQYKPEP
jgi:thiamine pyrophosphate-dependent acetolactate synthase large subunit-like protein